MSTGPPLPSTVIPMACGVLISAFSNESFVRTSALAAQHISLMNAPPGWCQLAPTLDRYPVVLATDLPGPVAHAAVATALAEAGSASNWPADPRFEVLLLGTPAQPHDPLPPPYYGIRSRHKDMLAWKWWRPQLYIHSPFELSLSLDTDALPCSAGAG